MMSIRSSFRAAPLLLGALLVASCGGQGQQGRADADDAIDVDDDCDGVIDNGFDLLSDGANCGACGIECGGEHTTAECV
ncbi:MAG: hypothetical protein JRG91_21000, partial [Deltaproteobacteria bacterium]|nr:hypothetical protein [Deltaproteobacteria bacterium]